MAQAPNVYTKNNTNTQNLNHTISQEVGVPCLS